MNLRELTIGGLALLAACAPERTPESTWERTPLQNTYGDVRHVDCSTSPDTALNLESDTLEDKLQIFETPVEEPTKNPTHEICKDYSETHLWMNRMDNYRLANHVRQEPFEIIRRTSHIPHAYLELFKMHNRSHLATFSNESNLQQLAERIAKGIDFYRANEQPKLDYIFIDDGHGTLDPGTIDYLNGKKITETSITRKFQSYLADELEERGFTVSKLNFNRDVYDEFYTDNWDWQDARLDHYATTVRSLGNPENTIFLSSHVDGRPSDNYGPMIHYWKNENAEKLSESIAASIFPLWSQKFPEWSRHNITTQRVVD